MKIIEDALAALPARCEGGPYDGMIVAPGHYARVLMATEKAAMTFAGVRITSNPTMQEGFVILTRGGEVCGVVDFKSGKAVVARPSHNPHNPHNPLNQN